MSFEKVARPRRTGRTVALLGVLGALVISLFLVRCWPELRVQYHVFRLGREPGYFVEVIRAPPRVPEADALKAFLRTRRGKEALFREYERCVIEPVFAEAPDLARTVLEGLFWNGEHWVSFVEALPPRHVSMPGFRLKADPLRATVTSLLPSLKGEELRTPRFPGLRFEILQTREAFERCHRLDRVSIWPGGEVYACLVRRDAEEAVTAMVTLLETSTQGTELHACLDALGELGPDARAALPSIRRLLERTNRNETEVRAAAEAALRRIAGAQAG